MRYTYRGIILIIIFFPIVFIFPLLLNLINFYPNKFIFNAFYLGIIIICYASLGIWFYYVIKFVKDKHRRQDFSNTTRGLTR